MILQEFTIVREIKVGDILTSLSIIISAMVFLRAWAKDREIRNKERADKIRNAAAMTLAKLERWQELSLWLFQCVQPVFIETSEMFQKNFDMVATRDFLWKKLSEARTEIADKIIDEQIEIAYVELYSYNSEVYSFFTETIGNLKENQNSIYDLFIENTQNVVMSYKSRKENYQTAMMGNELRNITYEFQLLLKEKTDKTLKPIHEFLVSIISESDKEVLKRKRLPK